jgi:hypothetical protein
LDFKATPKKGSESSFQSQSLKQFLWQGFSASKEKMKD